MADWQTCSCAMTGWQPCSWCKERVCNAHAAYNGVFTGMEHFWKSCSNCLVISPDSNQSMKPRTLQTTDTTSKAWGLLYYQEYQKTIILR